MRFHADGLGLALPGTELQLSDTAALQGDLATLACLVAAMAATQVGEQFHLLLVIDHVVRGADIDPGLAELRKQAFHGNVKHLGKLFYCYFGHLIPSSKVGFTPRQTTGHAPS